MAQYARRVGTNQVVLKLRPVRGENDQVDRIAEIGSRLDDLLIDRTLGDDVLNLDALGYVISSELSVAAARAFFSKPWGKKLPTIDIP